MQGQGHFTQAVDWCQCFTTVVQHTQYMFGLSCKYEQTVRLHLFRVNILLELLIIAPSMGHFHQRQRS